MKLAFIFDAKFTRYAGHYYSTNLTETLWNTRYLQVFDEVVVVGRVTEADEDPSGRLIRSDFKQVSFRCIENIPPLRRVFSQSRESAFIKEAIADCDVVICRGWWGTRECRALGKKYIVEVVSCVWDAMWNHSTLGKMVALPFYILQRLAVKKAPCVMYVTKQFLQRRYPTRGIQIGITDTELPPETDKTILEKRKAHIAEERKVITLGTSASVSVAYKGQKYVIEALAILKARGFTNYKYQMAGGGDQTKLRDYAERKGVSDQMEFLGAVPHDHIFPWLDSLDIYVQPSFQEGLSRAIIEAMSRGLPCVVSDAGGNPELIEQKFVCRRRGHFAENLADTILKMDRNARMSCAERNYQFAREFSAEKVNAERIHFLRDFVN